MLQKQLRTQLRRALEVIRRKILFSRFSRVGCKQNDDVRDKKPIAKIFLLLYCILKIAEMRSIIII